MSPATVEVQPEKPRGKVLPAFPSGGSRVLGALLVLGVFYTLYAARAFFLPVTFAVTLALLLRPLVRGLKRLHIPEGIGAGLVLIAALFLGGLALATIYEPAMAWARGAPDSLRQVELKLRELRRSVDAVGDAAARMEEMANSGQSAAPAVELKKPGWSRIMLGHTVEAVSTFVVMIFLVYFLLATGGRLLTKITELIARNTDARSSAAIVNDVERQVSRYLFTATSINIGLGLAVTLAMWAIGMPNPILWGAMGAVFNFVPYLGAAVVFTIVGLVAAVTFDDLRWLLAPATYAVINSIEGMLVTPMILGRRFELDPGVVFLWLVFWGWLWGVPGALLAMPMLTIIKIISEQVPSLHPLSNLLGHARSLRAYRREPRTPARAAAG